MIIQTGKTSQPSPFAKHLVLGRYKDGKTCNLIGSILGVMPWQKQGGVVDKPENLYVLATDAETLAGVPEFLTKSCKAPDEALGFNVINIEDDVRAAWEADEGYDAKLFTLVLGVLEQLKHRVQSKPGTYALLVSSITQLSLGMERAVVGSPDGKGYSDRNKWKIVSSRMLEILNVAQRDYWHCFWESHLDRAPDGNGGAKESMLMSGKAGRLWCSNVGNVFVSRRLSEKFPGTDVDKVYFDTQVSGDFIANGRGHSNLLDQKESDLTVVLQKLGKKVGGWGKKQ